MVSRKGIIFVAFLLMIAMVVIYNFPPVHDKLSWRIDNLVAQLFYIMNPPQHTLFIPKTTPVSHAVENISLTELVVPTITPEVKMTTIPTKVIDTTLVPIRTLKPTNSPTPIPSQVVLNGIIHEYQKWNNCGPTNLAMLLSFWGWQGDQRVIASFLKPNERDNNVRPDEMINYVNENTSLEALYRVGGDLELLKRILAAGYPVMVEKGLDHDNGWLGHYEVVNGYDDQKKWFITQDSFLVPNLRVSYEQMRSDWRAFNFLYLIVYPPDRKSQIQGLLGENWDEEKNSELASQIAYQEIEQLQGRDQAFAWFNLGSSLVSLKDFEGASSAYDRYFILYSNLPADKRPWRMMWYQNGPYSAYYNVGRYKDVISLASITLGMLSEKLLEEACYWRALSKEKIGDINGAIYDLKEAIRRNENYLPARFELNRLENIK